MKKIFLLTSLLLISILANAQFRVDSLGYASIGGNDETSTMLYVKNDTATCGIYFKSHYNNTQVGIKSLVSTFKEAPIVGIQGYANGYKANPYAIAVEGFSRCNNSATGIPIGIVGRLAATNGCSRGIGVYGSSNSGVNINYVDTKYAGFFYGLTRVQGNLTVTGQISGTLLTRSPSSMHIENALGASTVLITNKLKGLKTSSYMIEGGDGIRSLSAANRVDRMSYDTLSDVEIDEIESRSATELQEEEELSGIERQLLEKQHYGLSADQLEEVFPDLVYEQEDGTKSINYVEMVPILVQAINELKGEIEELRTGSDEGAKKAVQATSEGDSAEKLLLLSLGQNKPNPFSNVTTIEVCIPEDVQKAFIYVYDLQGKKVEQMDITARGKQNIQLTSAYLTDGMYLYSLIADGKVVETRRMIVEK